jgi:hypothetical protein
MALALPALAATPLTTTLSLESVRAYDDYVKGAEAKFDWRSHVPLEKNGVNIVPGSLNPTIALPGAIIHDWVAAEMVPNVTVEQVLAVLQSYGEYKRLFASQITDSKVYSHHGDQWRIYLKLYKRAVFTANLATEYDVEYRCLGEGRWAMLSHSTKVSEVEDGVLLPEGTGHGFLWRLNAYWVLEQRPEGVYIECRAISMSRDVPVGLGWALKGVVAKLPRESLRDTLESTARALRQQNAAREPAARIPALLIR